MGSSLWHLKSVVLSSLLEGENREGRLWYCITLSVTGKQFFRSSVKNFLRNEKWAWTPGHLKRYLLWNVKAAHPGVETGALTWDLQAKSREAGSRNLSINEIQPQNHHSKQQPGRKEHTCGRRGSQSPEPWEAGRAEASPLVSSARCEEAGSFWRWQLKCLVAGVCFEILQKKRKCWENK